jgi:hypothetical protein
MVPVTQGGAEFDPAAVERVEWLAQRDLRTTRAADAGADLASDADRAGDQEGPEPRAKWTGFVFEPAGHWTRFLRDAHPPRFPDPAGIEVREATDDSGNFGASATFGLHLPAGAERVLASLPGRPGWRCYLAHAGGSTPAAAATFTDGGIVLVAVDATAEAGRRGPARAALLHRIIGDAIEAGARLIGARIDEDSVDRADAAAGLLLAGFTQAYRCPEWVDAGLPAS